MGDTSLLVLCILYHVWGLLVSVHYWNFEQIFKLEKLLLKTFPSSSHVASPSPLLLMFPVIKEQAAWNYHNNRGVELRLKFHISPIGSWNDFHRDCKWKQVLPVFSVVNVIIASYLDWLNPKRNGHWQGAFKLWNLWSAPLAGLCRFQYVSRLAVYWQSLTEKLRIFICKYSAFQFTDFGIFTTRRELLIIYNPIEVVCFKALLLQFFPNHQVNMKLKHPLLCQCLCFLCVIWAM